MNPGGRTFLEQEAWDARARLEKNSEPHVMVKLPCCGSGVEITDTSHDRFVICPNPACRKRHVILSGSNPQIKSEEPESDGRVHLTY